MLDAGYRDGWGFGRHIYGSNYFHYVRDPWGSLVEYFWDIDFVPGDAEWEVEVAEANEESLYQWATSPPPEELMPATPINTSCLSSATMCSASWREDLSCARTSSAGTMAEGERPKKRNASISSSIFFKFLRWVSVTKNAPGRWIHADTMLIPSTPPAAACESFLLVEPVLRRPAELVLRRLMELDLRRREMLRCESP